MPEANLLESGLEPSANDMPQPATDRRYEPHGIEPAKPAEDHPSNMGEAHAPPPAPTGAAQLPVLTSLAEESGAHQQPASNGEPANAVVAVDQPAKDTVAPEQVADETLPHAMQDTPEFRYDAGQASVELQAMDEQTPDTNKHLLGKEDRHDESASNSQAPCDTTPVVLRDNSTLAASNDDISSTSGAANDTTASNTTAIDSQAAGAPAQNRPGPDNDDAIGSEFSLTDASADRLQTPPKTRPPPPVSYTPTSGPKKSPALGPSPSAPGATKPPTSPALARSTETLNEAKEKIGWYADRLSTLQVSIVFTSYIGLATVCIVRSLRPITVPFAGPLAQARSG